MSHTNNTLNHVESVTLTVYSNPPDGCEVKVVDDNLVSLTILHLHF